MEVPANIGLVIQISGRVEQIGQKRVMGIYLLWLDHAFDQHALSTEYSARPSPSWLATVVPRIPTDPMRLPLGNYNNSLA